MTESFFYSVRMHAAAGVRHLSGAERIVTGDRLAVAVSELTARAIKKTVPPDRVTITIDNLGPESPPLMRALDVVLMSGRSHEESRTIAGHMLLRAGVSDAAIMKALRLLSAGAASHSLNMRGAMIMNAKTGERLEPDPDRGVRASRFDWSPKAEFGIRKELEERGLAHFRTREALALATKVAHAPGVIAELCWSDDPDYTAGYVASLSSGYLRFPVLKQPGDDKGGRAIFIDPGKTNMSSLIEYLESEPVLIDGLGGFRNESA